MKKKDKKAPLSHISGVRKLKHTNSFTGTVAKYGVETSNEAELTSVSIYDIYIIKTYKSLPSLFIQDFNYLLYLTVYE